MNAQNVAPHCTYKFHETQFICKSLWDKYCRDKKKFVALLVLVVVLFATSHRPQYTNKGDLYTQNVIYQASTRAVHQIPSSLISIQSDKREKRNAGNWIERRQAAPAISEIARRAIHIYVRREMRLFFLIVFCKDIWNTTFLYVCVCDMYVPRESWEIFALFARHTVCDGQWSCKTYIYTIARIEELSMWKQQSRRFGGDARRLSAAHRSWSRRLGGLAQGELYDVYIEWARRAATLIVQWRFAGQ